MTLVIPDWQWSYDGWIIVVISLVAVICAIPGSFLLVRRQAMLGDAVSHAVLPGIAIGFLISGSRSGGWMLIGAILAGVTTSVLTQMLKGVAGVDRGAALGVVFSTLFALGLVLIVRIADSVDLDPACVLYGQVELVPLDIVRLGDMEIPRVVPWLLGALIGMSFVTGLFWKELLVSSFDAATAGTQGISASIMSQILMVMVAGACVMAFEAVGSILVIAMLITPPAIARLMTDRLPMLMVVAGTLGVLLSIAGQIFARTGPQLIWGSSQEVSIAGTIVVTLAIGLGGAASLLALRTSRFRGIYRRFGRGAILMSEAPNATDDSRSS